MFARILTFVMLYIIHQKFATCLIPPFDSHIRCILLKGFSLWLGWQLLVPGKEPAAIKFMSNLGGKVFLTEDGFIGLFNFLKYKMVSLPLTSKPQFRVHRNHLFGNRNENDLYSIKCRTNSYLHSFSPHSVKILNEIGQTLRQVPSLNIFKPNVLKLIRPQRRMYSIFMTLKAREDYFSYTLD